MEHVTSAISTQPPIQSLPTHVERGEKGKFRFTPHIVLFLVSTFLSIILFLLIVQVMKIPGVLVMIAVSLSNGISQFLIQPKKRYLWGPFSFLISLLFIMGISWILVTKLHA